MKQEFLNEAKLRFKDCTREEQHILLDAWIDRKLQYYSDLETWREVSEITFCNAWIMRTKPIKRLAIPWEYIKPKYRWAAMDEDGEVYIYDAEPTPLQEQGYWKDNTNLCYCVNFLSSIDTQGIDWRDSLVERPADK